MNMGGTGSAQEDQIITIQLEQALGVKFTYVPFKGGGEVCVNLVGKHVDSTVNNPDRVRQPLEGRAGPAARRSSTARGSPGPTGRPSPPSRKRSASISST